MPIIKGPEEKGGEQDAEDLLNQHKDLQRAIKELSEYGAVDVVKNMAIISLVGLQLKRSIGIAGKLFTALGDNNVNIEMISQGKLVLSFTSRTNRVFEEMRANYSCSFIYRRQRNQHLLRHRRARGPPRPERRAYGSLHLSRLGCPRSYIPSWCRIVYDNEESKDIGRDGSTTKNLKI